MPRLDIRIAEGRGFPKGGSKPDPYVTVTLGEEKDKTHTVAKSTNPRWQQVFKLKFDADSTDKLWLEVYNKNFFSDEKIGLFSIPIQQVVADCSKEANGVVDRWVRLQECSTIGEVHIRMNVEGVRSNMDAPQRNTPPAQPSGPAAPGQLPPPQQQRGRATTMGPGYVPPQDQGAQGYPGHAPPQNWGAPQGPPQGAPGYPPQGPPPQGGLPPQMDGGGAPGYPPQGNQQPPSHFAPRAPQGQFNPHQLYNAQANQQGNFGQAHWFAIPENEIRVQPGPPLFDLGKSITMAAYHPITNGSPSVLKRYRTIIPPSNEAFEALDKLKKASEHPAILYCFAPVRGNDPQGNLVGMLLGNVTAPLQDWIARTNSGTDVIIRALQSCAVGVAHLHGCGITHGNIKTSKLVVEVPRDPQEQPNFMLSAYGPSRLTGRVERTFYTAPEYDIIKGPACDVFSFGLTMWLILHGTEHEFIRGVDPQEVTRKLQNGERPQIDINKVGNAMAHLLESMWKPEPDRRPTMRAVVESLTAVVETFGAQAGLDPQMRCYVFAVERDPASHMNWINLARGLTGDKDTVTACGERHNKKTALTRAVECDSRQASCWIALSETMASDEKINIGGKSRGRRDCLVKAVLCDEQDSFPWATLARDLPTFRNDKVYIRPGLEDITKVDCIRKALGCDPSSSRGRTLLAQLKQAHPGIVKELTVEGQKEIDEQAAGASPMWVKLLTGSSEDDLTTALSDDPDCGQAWQALGAELSIGSEDGFPVNKRCTINGESYRADTCFAQAILSLDDPKNERSENAANRYFALAKMMLDDNCNNEVAGIKLFDACRRSLELRHLNSDIPPPSGAQDKADPHMYRLYQFVGKAFSREMGSDATHKISVPVFDGDTLTWKNNPEHWGKAQFLCHGLECRPLPKGGEPARIEHAPLFRMLLRESDNTLDALTVRGVTLSRGRCLAMLTQVEPSQARNWYDFGCWLEEASGGSCTMDLDALGSGNNITVTTIQALANALQVAEDGFENEGTARKKPNRITAQYWYKAGEIIMERRHITDMRDPRGKAYKEADCFKECLRCDPSFGPAWGKILNQYHSNDEAQDLGAGLGKLFKLEVLARFAVHEEIDVSAWKMLAETLLFDTSVRDTHVRCDFAPKNGRTLNISDCCDAIRLVKEDDADATIYKAADDILFYGGQSHGGKFVMVDSVLSSDIRAAHIQSALDSLQATAKKHPRDAGNSQLFWLISSMCLRLLELNGRNNVTIKVGTSSMTAVDCSFKALATADSGHKEMMLRVYHNHIGVHSGSTAGHAKENLKKEIHSCISLAEHEVTRSTRSHGKSSVEVQLFEKLNEYTWLSILDGIKRGAVNFGGEPSAVTVSAKIAELNTSWETEVWDAARPSNYFMMCQDLGKKFHKRSTLPGFEKQSLLTLEKDGKGATHWWFKLLNLCCYKRESTGRVSTEGEAWLGLAHVLVNDTHGSGPAASLTIPSYIKVSEHKVDAQYCINQAACSNPYRASGPGLEHKAKKFDSEVFTCASKLMINTNIASLTIEGRTWDVQKLVDEALSLWPDNAQAHKRCGRLALRANQTSQAKRSFERALRLDSSDSDVQALLGRILIGEGKYDEGNAHFVKAVEADPGSDFAWNNMGYALAGLPKDKTLPIRVEVGKSAQYHKGSHPIYEKPVDVRHCRGINFKRHQVYAIALECSESSSRVAYTWNCMGEALLSESPNATEKVLGSTYTAKSSFEKALELKPTSSRAMLGLATLEVTDREKRIALLELCLKNEPTNSVALDLVATALRLNATLRRPKTRLEDGSDAYACYAKGLSHSTSSGNIGRQASSWRGLGLVMQPNGQDVQLPCGAVSKRGCFMNALSLNSRDAVSWGGLGTTLKQGETVKVGGSPYDSRACFIFSVDFMDQHEELVDQAFIWNCMGAFLAGQQPLQLRSQPHPVDAQKCHQNALGLNPDGYTAGKLALTYPRGSPPFYDNLILACSMEASGGGAYWIELANALQPNAPYANVGGQNIGKVEMLKRGVTADPANAFGWICLGCTLQPHEYCQQYNPRECFMKSVTCPNPDVNGWNYIASTMNEYEQVNVYGHGMLTKADCQNRARGAR